MYFSPKDSKLYYILAQYSSLLRYSITICFLVIISVSWFFFAYSATSAQITSYKSKIKSLLTTKKRSVESHSICKNLENQISNLSSNLSCKLGLANCDVYQNLSKVIDCINKNNLILKKCMPGKIYKAKWYSKISFELLIESKFYDLYKFFTCLSSIDCFIEYSQCTLKKDNEKLICNIIFNFIEILT